LKQVGIVDHIIAVEVAVHKVKDQP
jgi:hypothetical protein